MAGFLIRLDLAVHTKNVKVAEMGIVSEKNGADCTQDAGLPVYESAVAVKSDVAKSSEIECQAKAIAGQPSGIPMADGNVSSGYLLIVNGDFKVKATADSAGRTISLLPV